MKKFNSYVDNLISSHPMDRWYDEDMWCDKFGSVEVAVEKEWFQGMLAENGWESEEQFYDEYTFDDTDHWLQKAIEDKALLGVSMGKVDSE